MASQKWVVFFVFLELFFTVEAAISPACKEKVIQQLNETFNLLKDCDCTAVPGNCAETYRAGHTKSGVYTINPDGSGEFDVFCDQETDGGGWTVFQKRMDGSVDFYRDWESFKNGFGNLNSEFWLGLDKIHLLTNSHSVKLRVDLEDWEGETRFAEYGTFTIANEKDKYKLSVGSYTGDAGDSLSHSHGSPFSTRDMDNDRWSRSCVERRKGAWWHKSCSDANLNSPYRHGTHPNSACVSWKSWKDFLYSMKRTEMKFRPVNF